MANNFNDNANKKNLNGNLISYTTYRTNYSNDEAMKENGGVPSSGGSSNLEDNKEVNITENGDIEITPTTGKEAMKKVTAHVDVAGGGSDVPSVMSLETYDGDAIMLFDDKANLTRLFAIALEGMNGWVDDISQISSSILGENGLLISQNRLVVNLTVLCVEYDNKMYKAPASVSNTYEKYDFVEVQSQATPPTSDTPSGTVASGTTIHLSTTETGGIIYYDENNLGFIEYDDSYGIEITDDTTIKAVVVADGKWNSEYIEFTYTVE